MDAGRLHSLGTCSSRHKSCSSRHRSFMVVSGRICMYFGQARLAHILSRKRLIRQLIYRTRLSCSLNIWELQVNACGQVRRRNLPQLSTLDSRTASRKLRSGKNVWKSASCTGQKGGAGVSVGQRYRNQKCVSKSIGMRTLSPCKI